MDLRKLKTLVDLVAESGISELEVTEDDGKVRIVNHRAASIVAPQVLSAAAPISAPAPSPAAAATPAPMPTEPEGRVLKSPMVGTFYRASSPGSRPFVEIGQEIKEGQAVCIIEAMKLLNEIEAEFSGVVKSILVENGQSVEFGQPLIVFSS